MAEAGIQEWVAKGVDAAAFSQLITSLALPWIYAERKETTVLAWLNEVQSQFLPQEQWRHGRVFGPDGELAWWRNRSGMYELRWLGETATTPPEGVSWQEIGKRNALFGPVSTLLHGDSGDGSSARWGEARIPAYQRYPVEGVPVRVRLQIQYYQGDGVSPIARLVTVDGIKGGSHG